MGSLLDEPLLSTREAAEKLGFRPKYGLEQVRKLIKDEGLPHVLIRGQYRIPLRALEEWVLTWPGNIGEKRTKEAS